MSQFDFGNIDPYVVDGVQLADMLNQWRDALYSRHRGAAQPAYIVPGLDWISDAAGSNAWAWQFYSGPAKGNLGLFTIDTVSGVAALAPAVAGVTTANPADASKAVATNEFVQAAIQAAIAGAALFPVGTLIDLVGSLAAAPAGWVLARDGTIGNAGSGATIRANADCTNLYAHLWNGLANTEAPVTGGRGANAGADFAAGKPIGGLDFRGVTRATFDSLGGTAAGRLNAFARIGIIGGEQYHQLNEAEMAYHTHSMYDPTHVHQLGISDLGLGGMGSGNVPQNQADWPLYTVGSATGVLVNYEGGNTSHNNVQPTRTVTTIIKL